MHDMDLLFLDEPTSGLDPIARRNILNMIKDLTKDGLSVLFTTHNLEEADYLCQRVAIMNNGKILASDTIDALKFDNLGSLRDYWAVSETQKPILNEKDFCSIIKAKSLFCCPAKSL